MSTYTEIEYQYDKIENDIVYEYIEKKNREHMLKTGYRKYTCNWVDEEDPNMGKYPVLYLYEYVAEDRQVKPVLRMKVIPVDEDGEIVQTKENKKEHERVIRTIQMEEEMIKAGMNIRSARKGNIPNFQPKSKVTE